MRLVRALKVSKLELPRPHASCVVAWRQVDALAAGSKEKDTILASVLAGAPGVYAHCCIPHCCLLTGS